MPWYTWLKRLKNSKNVGSVKKSSFVIIWLFSDGQKSWGVTPDKNFCDETKILFDIWTADHGREILIVYTIINIIIV